MVITIKCLGIRVIDSFNFLPMPLSRMPQCFGIAELAKGFFPHHFNTFENQAYVGPLPDIKYYTPEMMSSSVRACFMEWYEEHKNDVFDFQNEILKYCR